MDKEIYFKTEYGLEDKQSLPRENSFRSCEEDQIKSDN